MKRAPLILSILIIGTAIVLCTGYFIEKCWLMLAITLIANIVWLWRMRTGSSFISHFAFIINLSVATFGCVTSTPNQIFIRLCMILGSVLALGALDMALFIRRMQNVSQNSALQIFERQHISLICKIMCTGFFISSLPIFIKLHISFIIMIGLGFLLTFSWKGINLVLGNKNGDSQSNSQ